MVNLTRNFSDVSALRSDNNPVQLEQPPASASKVILTSIVILCVFYIFFVLLTAGYAHRGAYRFSGRGMGRTLQNLTQVALFLGFTGLMLGGIAFHTFSLF